MALGATMGGTSEVDPRSGPDVARWLTPGTLVVALLAALLSLVVPPADAQPPLLLPDLVSDPPVPSGGPQVVFVGGEPRLVLRFAGYVTNMGDGPLDITGNPQLADPSDPMSHSVYQRVRQGDQWVNIAKPLVRYETADGHNHFHLMEVTRYTLWNASRTAQVAPGHKVGFCLYDIERLGNRHPDPGPLTYTGTVVRWCESRNPDATHLQMGITEGWRDIYGADLTFQWVDISNVSPGEYWLASEADPFNRIVEKDESNNGLAFATQKSVVPGYVAQPVGPVPADSGTATQIPMDTTTFGAPSGARQFEITRGPAHGSIDLPIATPVSSDRLTYTPNHGFTGTDTIEFLVRQAGTPYPFEPTRATITIQVGDGTQPVVSISGAPGSLVTSTSAQLTALTANLAGGVTWSVNGVTGGSPALGTISASGLYVGPGAVPAGGVVVIRATSVSDPSVYDEQAIPIVAPANAAPTVSGPGDQQSTVGVPVSLGVTAFDPEGEPLAFTAQGLPPGLTIGLTNGTIVGTPTTVGVHSVRVDVSDGTNTTSTENFTWTVVAPPAGGANSDEGEEASGPAPPNEAPVISSPGDQSTMVGDQVTLAMTADDPDDDPLSWEATGLPVGLSIDPVSGLVTGTPVEAGFNVVTVRVWDGEDEAWVDFVWTVDDAMASPPPGGPVNLAPGRPAVQSSTGGGYGPWLANDGITDGDFWSGSVSHTSRDDQPWWQVDLGAIHELDSIVVWNRTDCCTWRLADFWVLVSDQPFGAGSVDALRAQPGVVSVFHGGEPAGGSTIVALAPGTSGRHVRVMLTATDYLQLAEVQVFGWP